MSEHRGNSIKSPFAILILTDGKIGDLAQCRGIASRLSSADTIVEHVVSPDWFHALPLPFMPVQKSDRQGAPDSPLNPPYPDMVLASGRRTVPYLRALRRIRGNNATPMIVFLKDPRGGRSAADFVWAPVHDELAGDDFITTHTSPHGFSDTTLDAAGIAGAKRFAKLPRPLVGVVLGGNSNAVKWDKQSSSAFATILRNISPDRGIVVTPSRRTPKILSETVAQALQDRPSWVWDGAGDNPYTEILASSDYLVVTGDSHNMVSECLAAGKAVHVFRPPRLQKKLQSFLDAMQAQGAIRDAAHGIGDFPPVKVDATEEIVEAILHRFQDRVR